MIKTVKSIINKEKSEKLKTGSYCFTSCIVALLRNFLPVLSFPHFQPVIKGINISRKRYSAGVAPLFFKIIIKTK